MPPTGHLGFIVSDAPATVAALAGAGYAVEDAPTETTFPGVTVVHDPDGYRVEIIERGCTGTA